MHLIIHFLDSGFTSSSFDASDIFSSMFSNFGSGKTPFSNFNDMAQFDADVESHLNLTFSESVLGCKKSIRYKRTVNCAGCNGTGAEKGTSPSVCSSCKGSGQVISPVYWLFKF